MNIKTIMYKEKHVTRLVFIMFIVFIVFSVLKPKLFLSYGNFNAMTNQFPEYGIMALGVTFALISGGIDLSFVAIANFTAIIAVMIMRNVTNGSVPEQYTIWIIFLAIVTSIALGAFIGFINGILCSRLGVPQILATLANMQVLTGLGIVLTRGRAISGVPLIYSEIGNTSLFGLLPVPLLVFVICFIATLYVLKHTVFGASLYMLGSNRKAALYSGLNSSRIINSTHVIVGVTAAIAGLIMISSYNSAKATYGSSYMLQAIMIAVYGGVGINGGKGNLWGVLIAVITVQMISSGINMFANVNVHYRELIWGTLLIVMMLVNYFESIRKPRTLPAQTKK